MPRKEYSFLSQKDPQPQGRQILMDSAIVANPVTARNGAAPGVCSLSALHNLLSRAICQFLEVPLRCNGRIISKMHDAELDYLTPLPELCVLMFILLSWMRRHHIKNIVS